MQPFGCSASGNKSRVAKFRDRRAEMRGISKPEPDFNSASIPTPDTIRLFRCDEMDPISIVVSVAGLINLCKKTGEAIKSAHDGAKIVDSKIEALDSEIQGYAQVLELMKSTIEDETIQKAFQSTGHIGNHWKNIYAAAEDGHQTLEQLHLVLLRVDKSVTVLDSTRKHFRLKSANDEIEMYQRKIKTYRDTMQMSIQTVILWNQVSHHESTDKIMPGLDELTQSIQNLSININAQVASLHTIVESNYSRSQLQMLEWMKGCVQTAADVVSSASTTLGLDDRATVVAPSELGDLFGLRAHDSVMRWIDGDLELEGAQREGPGATMPPPDGIATPMPTISTLALDESDSDGEIERELIEAHLKRGREERKRGRMTESIRYIERALARVRTHEHRFASSELKIDVLEELLAAYLDETDLYKAKAVAMERLQLLSRSHNTPGQDDSDMRYLVQALLLGTIFSEMGDPTQARIYAKKCIKGYRKVGKTGRTDLLRSIALMVSACRAAGDGDEGEAYQVMLDDLSTSIQEEEDQASRKSLDDNDSRRWNASRRRRRSTTPSDSDSPSRVRVPRPARQELPWRRRHNEEDKPMINSSNNDLQSQKFSPMHKNLLQARGRGDQLPGRNEYTSKEDGHEERSNQLQDQGANSMKGKPTSWPKEVAISTGVGMPEDRSESLGGASPPVGGGIGGVLSVVGDIPGGQSTTTNEKPPALPTTEEDSVLVRRRRRREERKQLSPASAAAYGGRNLWR